MNKKNRIFSIFDSKENIEQKLWRRNQKIGDMICSKIKDVVPDIQSYVNINFPCRLSFYSKALDEAFIHRRRGRPRGVFQDWENLGTIIIMVFPELQRNIYSPVSCLPDKRELIITKLKELREESGNGEV